MAFSTISLYLEIHFAVLVHKHIAVPLNHTATIVPDIFGNRSVACAFNSTCFFQWQKRDIAGRFFKRPFLPIVSPCAHEIQQLIGEIRSRDLEPMMESLVRSDHLERAISRLENIHWLLELSNGAMIILAVLTRCKFRLTHRRGDQRNSSTRLA